jgi:hypothetical protein
MEKDSLGRAIEEIFKEEPLPFSKWIEQFIIPGEKGAFRWWDVSLQNCLLKKEGQMRVEAYTKHHVKYTLTAKNKDHAREIANRIITEGLWITADEGTDKGTEVFFPVHQIFKVKIIGV